MSEVSALEDDPLPGSESPGRAGEEKEAEEEEEHRNASGKEADTNHVQCVHSSYDFCTTHVRVRSSPTPNSCNLHPMSVRRTVPLKDPTRLVE